MLLLYALDGIIRSRSGIDRAIHDAKCPGTQDRLNLERTAVDGLTQKLGCRHGIGHWGRGVDEDSNRAPVFGTQLLEWLLSG